VDLRPLTLAELLDRAFSTYRQHVWLFVGIMAVPAVASMVFAVAMEIYKGSFGPTQKPEDLVLRGVVVLAGSFGFALVYLLAYAFALGATTIAVSQLYMGRDTTVGAAYAAVRRHGGRLVVLLLWIFLRLWLTMLAFFAVGAVVAGLLGRASPILSVLFVAAGLIGGGALVTFMVVRWGVAVPAAVLEDLTARTSLVRSIELTVDNRGRVFLVILCAAVITYATALLLQAPFIVGATLAGPGTPTAVTLGIAGAVLGGIGGMFTGPIMIIGLAMMYYDLRIRKEAFDLQLMLEALDPPPGS
jgi:hypothetical protein